MFQSAASEITVPRDVFPVHFLPARLGTVSYTHLDVYKRQGLGNALVLDAGHHSPHFFIIPNLKGMVLELSLIHILSCSLFSTFALYFWKAAVIASA